MSDDSNKPELKHTPRGFGYFEMKDSYNEIFTIQMSSAASQEKIWMGIGDNRAHLTRDMVRSIIPILQQFADTGVIAEPGTYEASDIEREWLKLMDETAEPVLKAIIDLIKTTQEWG